MNLSSLYRNKLKLESDIQPHLGIPVIVDPGFEDSS